MSPPPTVVAQVPGPVAVTQAPAPTAVAQTLGPTAVAQALAPTCAQPVANLVVVHGILGWGPDELNGIPHIQHAHVLEETGCFDVYTVAVAPLGSDWDRCAQLFAQMVGGYADHGLAHSTNESTLHNRYGNTPYPALIPDFLEPGSMRTYFVGHSQVCEC